MAPALVGPSIRGVEHPGVAQDCSTHTFDVSPQEASHGLLPSRSTCCNPKRKSPSLDLPVEKQIPHHAQGDNQQREHYHSDTSNNDSHKCAQDATTARTQPHHTKPHNAADAFTVEVPTHTTHTTQDRQTTNEAMQVRVDAVEEALAVSTAQRGTPSRTKHVHSSSTGKPAAANATAAVRRAHDAGSGTEYNNTTATEQTADSTEIPHTDRAPPTRKRDRASSQHSTGSAHRENATNRGQRQKTSDTDTRMPAGIGEANTDTHTHASNAQEQRTPTHDPASTTPPTENTCSKLTSTHHGAPQMETDPKTPTGTPPKTPEGGPPVLTAEEQERGEREILEMEKGGARRLHAEDAQERGHERDEDMESDDMEGESPAIKAIEQDEPASQAAVDRMKSEKLEQVVIIIRAREDPNHTSYLYGFEDDLMIRQNNARKISDAIFSY